jgi:hypothetical protein
VAIDPQDQEKMTFTCPFSTFAYRRMPFGLCNAPTTFQRCMMSIFSDMVEKFLELFMDDFSVFRPTFNKCLHNLSLILQRCKETNLILSWEKSHFMVQEGIVLGHSAQKRDRSRQSESVANFKTSTAYHVKANSLISQTCRLLSPLH